jgi:iron complex transport system substrate-binding protein
MRLCTLMLTLLLVLYPKLLECKMESKRIVVDDFNRRVCIPINPQRIVSLGPSVTEILCAIGATENIVGITDYCNYPEQIKNLPSIGGFVTPNMEKIIALSPDLIIGRAPGTKMPVVKRLASLDIPVFIIYPKSIQDVIDTVTKMGNLVNKKREACLLYHSLTTQITKVRGLVKSLKRSRALYLIGFHPFVTVNRDTLGGQLIELAGGINIAANMMEQHPRCNNEWIIKEDPDVIILSTMQQKFGPEFASKLFCKMPVLSAVRANRIFVIESELIDRPSPRIAEGLSILAEYLHPEIKCSCR